MRKHTNRKLAGLLLAFASYAPGCFADGDNAHFWKVARFHGDATTARWEYDQKYENADWLTKLDFSYAYGSTRKGFNNHGNKTHLLNIYGEQNMLYLFTNVPLVPSELNFAEFLGTAINSSDTNGTFGLLESKGKFIINEFNIDIRQNLALGFYLKLCLPIRDVSIKGISFEDESPLTGMFSQQNPDWIRFLNNLDTILNNHGLHSFNHKYSKTAPGDLTLVAGWDHIDMESCDFIRWFRFALEVGVLFPTGKKDNADFVFSVPTGYDGHWGIPLSGLLEVGITNWLAWGLRAGALFFFDNTVSKRVKTATQQNGFLNLVRASVKEEEGTVWYVGTDLKLDHVFQGFSFLLGYSYNRGERNHWHPRGSCCRTTETGCVKTDFFDNSIVNSDSRLRSWSQHVLHFIWDYDFSVHCALRDKKYAPRINVFYNLLFDGNNVFDTSMVGGGIGLDIRWDF